MPPQRSSSALAIPGKVRGPGDPGQAGWWDPSWHGTPTPALSQVGPGAESPEQPSPSPFVLLLQGDPPPPPRPK